MSKIHWQFRTDSLQKFLENHAVWDPMIVNYKNNWLLYVLVTKKAVDQKTFFTQDNYIHGFRSKDLNHWEDLGPIFVPWDRQQRLCAGSLFVENDTIYFFGSYTIDIVPLEVLDQRLFLATSTDGKNFTIESNFSLLPDPILYGTKRRHPDTEEMVFAWRDPYLFKDPKSGQYYLFICAGAERWEVPPTVAVAVSNQITGPYELLPPAVDIEVNIQGKTQIPLKEIERVHIILCNNKYYMFFSCWKCYLTSEFSELCQSLNREITNSNIYVLSSERVTGPYTFDLDYPIVKNSEKTGLYGICLLEKKHKKNEYILTGWHPKKFTLCVSDKFRLISQGKYPEVKKRFKLPIIGV